MIGSVGVVAPGPGSSVSATTTPSPIDVWTVLKDAEPLPPTAKWPIGTGAPSAPISHAS